MFTLGYLGMAKDQREAALGGIGARIRQRRRELNMTQEDVATEAAVSKSFVSEVEGGSTAASGLVYLRLAQVLDVSVQWLLTGTEPTAPEAESVPRIPRLLSELAEEKGWSHQEVLDIAAQLEGILARRTRAGRVWEPSREYILAIARALQNEAKR